MDGCDSTLERPLAYLKHERGKGVAISEVPMRSRKPVSQFLKGPSLPGFVGGRGGDRVAESGEQELEMGSGGYQRRTKRGGLSTRD